MKKGDDRGAKAISSAQRKAGTQGENPHHQRRGERKSITKREKRPKLQRREIISRAFGGTAARSALSEGGGKLRSGVKTAGHGKKKLGTD